MTRATLLCFLMLLIAAVPAAGSEIQLIDGATGAARIVGGRPTDVNDGPERMRWTDDETAVLLNSGPGFLRVGVGFGSVQGMPSYDSALSVGPGGRSVEPAHSSEKHTRVQLRSPARGSIGIYDLGTAYGVPSISWSPDGARVAVAIAPVLSVVDTATGAVVMRRRVKGAEIGEQAFSPDASAVFVTSGERLLRVDLPSGHATTLLRTGNFNDPPTAEWGLTGRIAVRTQARLRVLGAPGVDLDMGFTGPSFIAWNPGGTALSYGFDTANGDCSPAQGVGVVVPGQAPHALVPTGDRELKALAWSSDGSTLAVELGPEAVVEREHRGRRGRWPATVGRDYMMGSRRGNAAVRKVVLRASRALRGGAGRELTLLGIRNELNRLEWRLEMVGVTDVREAVAEEIDPWLHAAGWRMTDSLDDVTCDYGEAY